jgi:homoserine kinase type II
MPGEADYHRTPSEAKLRAALAALARFHRAAVTHGRPASRRGPSPGVANRLAEIERWLQGDLHRLAQRIVRSTMPELAERVRRLVELFPQVAASVRRHLEAVALNDVPLQPCLRDVWSDHVLFRGERVSGLIDFGAMRVESPAADVARLLGSMAGDRWDEWQTGLSAYQEVRPLEAAEQRLVEVLDASTALLSGMNWARWIYLDDRQFDDYPTILERLSGFLDRVERLAQTDQRRVPFATR